MTIPNDAVDPEAIAKEISVRRQELQALKRLLRLARAAQEAQQARQDRQRRVANDDSQ